MAKESEKTTEKTGTEVQPKRRRASRAKKDEGPSVSKVRTGTPELLGPFQPCYAFQLEPIQQINGRPIHAPVDVWGHKVANGWQGWLEERRQPGIQAAKVEWSSEKYRELPAKPEFAKKAKAG